MGCCSSNYVDNDYFEDSYDEIKEPPLEFHCQVHHNQSLLRFHSESCLHFEPVDNVCDSNDQMIYKTLIDLIRYVQYGTVDYIKPYKNYYYHKKNLRYLNTDIQGSPESQAEPFSEEALNSEMNQDYETKLSTDVTGVQSGSNVAEKHTSCLPSYGIVIEKDTENLDNEGNKSRSSCKTPVINKDSSNGHTHNGLVDITSENQKSESIKIDDKNDPDNITLKEYQETIIGNRNRRKNNNKIALQKKNGKKQISCTTQPTPNNCKEKVCKKHKFDGIKHTAKKNYTYFNYLPHLTDQDDKSTQTDENNFVHRIVYQSLEHTDSSEPTVVLGIPTRSFYSPPAEELSSVERELDNKQTDGNTGGLTEKFVADILTKGLFLLGKL